MNNYNYFGSHKYLIVPLLEMSDEEFVNESLTSSKLKVFEFTDPRKFGEYILADFIYEISEKCNADWLDDYETQTLYPNVLPVAIEIVSKAIKQKKNALFVDYLEKTKEMMELALSLNTFICFSF